MNNDVQDAIRQADLLMKEGKYKSAWNLLLPYKSDPAARKRLAWLDQKRQQASQSKTKENKGTASQSRTRLFLLVALVIILAIGGFAIYRTTQQNPVPSTQVTDSTALAVAPTEGVTATPFVVLTVTATEIPPTENSQESSLQQQLRDWLATVEGVSQVLSFDVDIPGDEPPLVYVELLATAGHNDTHIPELLVQKLNETLNTTQYSDFLIIINDDQRVIEYRFNSVNNTWEQTELSSSIATTAEPGP